MLNSLIIVSAIAILITVFYFKMKMKYNAKLLIINSKLDKQTSKFKKWKSLLEDNNRKGYYDIDYLHNINKDTMIVRVFVEEIDRFTNGECEIKFQKAQVIDSAYKYRSPVLEKAEEDFVSVKSIQDIEWLVSEEDIKEIRRKKLIAIDNFNNAE